VRGPGPGLLEEFIDSVIGGDRFVVAGTSYGAYLALGLVHRRAGRIEGVLMSVPGLLQDEELPEFVKTLENGKSWRRHAPRA